MSRLRARGAGERGFTLVEVTVASLILMVGVLGVLTLLDRANAGAQRTRVRDGAISLGRELIEAARAVPYPDLSQATVNSQIQGQPGLADSTGDSTWNIERRGITYTVAATVCSVDGATDNYGDHGGGSFCPDSTRTATGAGADKDPDDYKRVAVEVSWQVAGEVSKVRQEAVLNDPGSAFAPSVTAMTPKPNPANVTDPATTSIPFTNVTTSTRAESVRWYVDNVERGSATQSGSTWQFTWNIGNTTSGVTDGVYLVRAQAFDRYGQTGAGYVVTVVINRSAPLTPTGVVGGRNPLWASNLGTSNLVELEWNPNPERDVTGYEAYRVKGASPNLSVDGPPVCKTQVSSNTATSCVDANAPAGNQRYYVIALGPARPTSGDPDRSAIPGTLLQSDAPPNARPTAPTAITATALTGGGVQLTWTAGADPDHLPLRYYRIYRDDGSSVTGRYDFTDTGSILSWTDSSPSASSHRYWVTAVDDRLAESPLAPDGGITP